jgi:Leucine-rich repeat (LRR) protein
MTTDIDNIYNELKNKVNTARLKEISVEIISRYKRKNTRGLLFYAQLLGIDASNIDINRLFARIIQIYHPDKIIKIQNEFETHYKNNNIAELVRLKNIYIFKEITRNDILPPDEESDETYSYSDADFGYDEKFRYDDDFIHEEEFAEQEDVSFSYGEYGFIEAINRLVFGNLDLTVSADDLQGLNGELDLSDYEICDLEGIEYCISINGLNLSGNNIRNINRLSYITQLESLFLSGNIIQNIDGLSGLFNLKELDISFNEVEDISVLLNLENLSFVNMMGNPIKDEGTIKALTDRGVLVIY